MTHVALLVLATATLIGVVAMVFELVLRGRKVRRLVDQPGRVDGPLVSIIVAARDEGPNIEASLASVLAQDYERLEVIAIDDRSTDDTGVVLDRMAREDARVRVLHVTELPPHWLGKNHALNAGAAIANGEYLLFTDADIIFDKQAVSRGVSFLDQHQIDHLTVGPKLDSPSLLLEMAVSFFSMGFLFYFKPYLAENPKRKEHIGIGAFNMVRAELYRSFGGHSRIALRPDDDLKLGRLVKLAGGRQMVAGGVGVLTVRWYSTVGELARGLRKNTFAAMNYRVSMAVGGIVVQLVVNIWPFVALFVTAGALWWLNLGIAVLLVAMLAAISYSTGARPWLAIGYPVAAAIFVYIIAAATWITVRRGGIEWRGTFYSLRELQGNRV